MAIKLSNRAINAQIDARTAARGDGSAASAIWKAAARARRFRVRAAHAATLDDEALRAEAATMAGRRMRRLAREKTERDERRRRARLLALELFALARGTAVLAHRLRVRRPQMALQRQVLAAVAILRLIKAKLLRWKMKRSIVVVRFFCREMSIIFKLRHGCLIGKKALRLITRCGTRAITIRAARASRLRNQFEAANDRRISAEIEDLRVRSRTFVDETNAETFHRDALLGERPELLHYASAMQLQRLVVPIDKSLRHSLIHKFQAETRFAATMAAREGEIPWSRARARQLRLVPEEELEAVLRDGVARARVNDPDYSASALKLKAHNILPDGVEHLDSDDDELSMAEREKRGRRSIALCVTRHSLGNEGGLRKLSLIAPKQRRSVAPSFAAVVVDTVVDESGAGVQGQSVQGQRRESQQRRGSSGARAPVTDDVIADRRKSQPAPRAQSPATGGRRRSKDAHSPSAASPTGGGSGSGRGSVSKRAPRASRDGYESPSRSQRNSRQGTPDSRPTSRPTSRDRVSRSSRASREDPPTPREPNRPEGDARRPNRPNSRKTRAR